MFSCHVSSYVVYITFWWLINFSRSTNENEKLEEKLAKLEADFIMNFGAESRLNWDQIKPIQNNSALLADMCDNAHIQAGKGQINLRESRIVNAILRFRNTSYGKKEIEAIKCRPKVHRDSQFINTHPNRHPQPQANIMIPRRPSINPNRKMKFGLHTLEMDSENQKKDKIIEQSRVNDSPEEIGRQNVDLEQNMVEDYHPNSKEKGKEDLELEKDRRRVDNHTVKNDEKNYFDPEKTASQMGDSEDRPGNTLRKRRGEKKSGNENQSTETIKIVIDQKQAGLKQNGDQPHKNPLNEVAYIDSNVKYLEKKNDFLDNLKEIANKRKCDFDMDSSQRARRRDTFEEASSSSSHYPRSNSDEIRDPDTNLFYLTQGLSENCVFYLHSLIDKSRPTFYDEVEIVRHICGLIIPPDKISA